MLDKGSLIWDKSHLFCNEVSLLKWGCWPWVVGYYSYWWTEINTMSLSASLSFCTSLFRPYSHHRECDKRGSTLFELASIGGGVWTWCSNSPAMSNDMWRLCTGRVFCSYRSSCLLEKACQGTSQAGRRGSSHSGKTILASGCVFPDYIA